MFKVGIAGGIGSGKTTVCRFFELLGIPVFYSDRKAGIIMQRSSSIRLQLTTLFGKDIYRQDSTLDRKKLAEIVFQSPSLLEKLNSVVHPEIRNCFMSWVAEQHAPYVVQEAAILFESRFNEMMDFNILVTAPQEMRISRVTARDGLSRDEVLLRMSRQWPEEKKEALADYVLRNDNRELIIPQLLELDKKFRSHG